MHDLLSALPSLSVTSWLLVIAGALVVGFSKTALPGGGTIAVGLFALALPAKESTAALLFLLIVGDVTALIAYRRDPDWRTLVRLIPGVVVGLALGAVFLALADADSVRRGISVILLALVAVTAWRRRSARRRANTGVMADTGDTQASAGGSAAELPQPGRAVRAGYGALGGFTTMVANAGGPVMSMYFYAMRMPVVTFLGTAAWFFAIVNVLKLPFSAGLGLVRADLLLMDALLVPLVILAAGAGRRIAGIVPQHVFENAVLVLTVLASLALLVI